MLYQYNPVQKQTKERIWQVPYIPKKQRTSITNFTKPKKRRTFGIVTTSTGQQFIVQYIKGKEASRIEMPQGISTTEVLRKLSELEV